MKIYFSGICKVLVCVVVIMGYSLSGTGQVTVEVKKWKDDKKSAVSLTFDDGTLCHYDYVRHILNNYGFKATFNLVPAWISNSKNYDGKTACWYQFAQMANEGQEMASHAMTHPHLETMKEGDMTDKTSITYEIAEAKKLIEQNIPFKKCLTFAYPFCTHNDLVDRICAKYHYSARSCSNPENNSSPSIKELFGLNSFGVSWGKPRNVPADDKNELQSTINLFTQNSVNKGKWAILLAHEVIPFNQIKNASSWEPTSTDWLIWFCDWLKEKSDNNEIWVETQGNVVLYIKERDNFSAKVIDQTDWKIEILSTDTLDNQVFNFPLSIDVNIPAGWEKVKVTQGLRSEILIPEKKDDKTFVRTSIIPDGGNLILSKLAFNSPFIKTIEVDTDGKNIQIKFDTNIENNADGYSGFSLMVNNSEPKKILKAKLSPSDPTVIDISLEDSITSGQIVNISYSNGNVLSADKQKLEDLGDLLAINKSRLVIDKSSPVVPANFIYTNENNSLILRWSPSVDNVKVGGYQVYRNNSLLASTIDTFFVFNDLTLTEAEFILIAYDISGNQSSSKSLKIDKKTGIHNPPSFEPKLGILFPNPSGQQLNFEFICNLKNVEISIVDLNGKTISTNTYNNVSKKGCVIDINALSKGMYCLIIKNKNEKEIHRFIKE